VYRTDVEAAGDVAEAVAIPTDLNVVANYPIASVTTSTQTAVDQAFINFLTSADGQAILARYGFGPKP
jgi:molybdate transport system substrate-binding protein